MSGAWYGFATIAVAIVIRWYIQNDSGPAGRDAGVRKKAWRSDSQ
jgi:hypothetical protein